MNFGLSNEDILRIQGIFATHPKVLEVILFGSRAMGNYKSGSDIDLAIVSEGLTFSELLEIDLQLEQLGLLYKTDLQDIKKIKDSNVLEHIHRVGKVFYKKVSTNKT